MVRQPSPKAWSSEFFRSKACEVANLSGPKLRAVVTGC
jgi:hypothetical protein